MKKLCIDLDTLPAEGKSISGEIDGDIFGIDSDELRSVGALTFELHVQQFEEELFLRGKIAAPFLFRCVRCLHHFPMTMKLDNFSESVEISGKRQVDVSDVLREELVMEFPAYPKCEDSDMENPCNIKSTHFGVDKEGQMGVNSPAPSGNSGVWDALDALGDQ
ncbi:MAG: hypothetical protein RR250_03530 [Akkermansia sp.]